MNTNDRNSPEFDLLASTSQFLQTDLDESNDRWEGSPFEWIIKLPSATKGKVGKRLVAQWCAAMGLSANPSGDPEADILINSKRVEIKFSTL